MQKVVDTITQPCQTKDNKICNGCISTQHAAFGRKSMISEIDQFRSLFYLNWGNPLGGLLPASSAEGFGFNPHPSWTKDMKNLLFADLFSMKHLGVRLAQSQNSRSGWNGMSFQQTVSTYLKFHLFTCHVLQWYNALLAEHFSYWKIAMISVDVVICFSWFISPRNEIYIFCTCFFKSSEAC